MKCEIIKDLLPLYCDGLVSDVTREEVEKHLESCNDCRDVCKHMKEAVPEVPKPDIQPMKKIKRTLRLRLLLIVAAVCFAFGFVLYQLLVADPLPISSEKVSYEYFSRCAGQLQYVYDLKVDGIIHRNNGYDVPAGSDFRIDKENNCVWLDGEKVIAGMKNNEVQYVPADGELVPAGVLTLKIKCDTFFKCVRYEHTPVYYVNSPAETDITFRPCLPFSQDINNCITEDGIFRMEFSAGNLGEGAQLTIKCRDKDVVIDLHELALEEGLLSE